MNQRLPVLAFFILMVTATSCKEDEENCYIGAEGCRCTEGGTCDNEMICNEHRICVSSTQNIVGEFKPKAPPCGGTPDSVTGLEWEDPVTTTKMTLTQAREYCAGFEGNWRLPTIDELRTIVSEECAPIAPEGDCPISAQSTSEDWNEMCFSKNNGCEDARAGVNNCFLKKPLTGKCTSYFWSSSVNGDGSENSWVISFDRGSIFHSKSIEEGDEGIAKTFYTRCVCDPNPPTDTDSDTTTDQASSLD
ncbi:MAG: DUF1566 domain-containing protein [Deltaproteobacteria bacterium]|nr:DUF1566 domain-containing protein [Deltaproteobacteria bacterium]